MLYSWKIKSYAYLVKIGEYNLEAIEGSGKLVVEEGYRESVALYLTTGKINI